MTNKIGRNDPCPCGSGKKYKKCCFSLEATQLTAVSGNSYISNDVIPDDVPREKLLGKVLSNDGVKAEVDPQDGKGQMVTFFRDKETRAEFAKAYPVGGRVEIQRLDMRVHMDEEAEPANPLEKMQADIALAHSLAKRIYDIFEKDGVSEDMAACTVISMALTFIGRKWGEGVMEQVTQALDKILPHRQADAKFWNVMEDAKEYDKPAEVYFTKPPEEWTPEERETERARMKADIDALTRDLKNKQARLRRLRAKKARLKPDLGNSAVRHYRGASGNVAMAELRTHLATERVRVVALCLTQTRPSSIPTKIHQSNTRSTSAS
jgi:hypothetical protein